MRSACQGPVAFTISSIVNEPRGPIDSTEEHEQHQQFPILSVTIPCNWIEALSMKVNRKIPLFGMSVISKGGSTV